MNLNALLQPFVTLQIHLNLQVTGLSQDSRHLKKGEVFFAFPGTASDGRLYMQDAFKKGAVAIVIEAHNQALFKRPSFSIPVIPLLHLSQKLSAIAARFYGYPAEKMQIIGVTGTNGKTSCTHFLAAALAKVNRRCGVIGGLRHCLYTRTQMITLPKHNSLTTASAIEVQYLLTEFKKRNTQIVIIEASSHGLLQHRLQAVPFQIAAFTNLSHDHLDYHHNYGNYANAKKILFQQPTVQWAILNIDDAIGFQWQSEFQKTHQVYTYSSTPGTFSQGSHCRVYGVTANLKGITATLETPWGTNTFHNPFLLGQFNVNNLLLVVTIMGILHIPFHQILTSIQILKPITGRMQQLIPFTSKKGPRVIIDYAHTPDALKKVLSFLKPLTVGRLWCVFGCGGDRDVNKRAHMGRIATQYSDHVIVTQDNSRFEKSEQIFQEILSGVLSSTATVSVITDRAKAIKIAIYKAAPQDMILIAGKGHENYQIIEGMTHYFSDIETAQQILLDYCVN